MAILPYPVSVSVHKRDTLRKHGIHSGCTYTDLWTENMKNAWKPGIPLSQ